MGTGVLSLLVVRPYGAAFAPVITRYAGDKSVQILECSSTLEAVSRARHLEWAFILCHVGSQEDLVKVITMMKFLSVSVKKKRVRAFATVKQLRDNSIEPNLKFYGVSEVVFEPISEKSILFKIDRQLRLSLTLLRRERQATGGGAGAAPAAANPASRRSGPPSTAAAGPRRGGPDSGEDAGGKPRARLLWGPPISLQSDFWLATGAEIKSVRDRWLIRLDGPDMTFGKWIRIKDSGDPGIWQWVSSGGERDPFYRDKGIWCFRGQRPELQGERWFFTGPVPELYFADDAALRASVRARKFSVDADGNLTIAKDSAAARAMRRLVLDSFNADVAERMLRDSREQGRRPGTGRSSEPAYAVRAPAEAGGADPADGFTRLPGAPATAPAEPLPGANKVTPARMRYQGPLNLRSDCWVLEERKPRRVAAKWVVRMMGPGTDSGRWERYRGSDTTWIWMPTPREGEADPFVREKGSWVFHGQLPKLQDSDWIFVGETPRLEFLPEGRPNQGHGFARISVDPSGVLLLARDSPQALALRSLLRESQRRKIRSDEAEADDVGPNSDGVGGEEANRAGDRGRVDKIADRMHVTHQEASDASDDARGGGWGSVGARAPEGSESQDDYLRADATEEGGVGGPERQRVAAGRRGAEGVELSRPDLDSEVSGGAERGDFFLESEAARQGKDLSVDLDPEGLGRELNGEFSNDDRAGRELNARLGTDDLGTELVYDGEGDVAGAGPRDGRGDDAAKKKAKGAGIEPAPDPAHPSLSAIALAALMSELVIRREMSRPDAARKYCDYVAKASGGMKVELWDRVAFVGDRQWDCVGTDSGAAGSRLDAVEKLKSEPKLIEEGLIVVPIYLTASQGVAGGALVICGTGAERVPMDWVQAAGRMTVGLLKAHSASPASSVAA